MEFIERVVDLLDDLGVEYTVVGLIRFGLNVFDKNENSIVLLRPTPKIDDFEVFDLTPRSYMIKIGANYGANEATYPDLKQSLEVLGRVLSNFKRNVEFSEIYFIE